MDDKSLNYQFLLLTHVICADGQIHSEETKALQELAQVAEINDLTLLEMDKILAQEENHLSVEAIANRIPQGLQTETMRQVLAIAHIDGYFAPLERKLVNKICEVWHWKPQDVEKLLEKAENFKPNKKTEEDQRELSFTAKLLKNEQKSPLSRAIIGFAAKISPETIGQTVKKLEREILLAGPEYDQAIAQCAKIAQEDYKFAASALQKVNSTLRKLASDLKQTIEQIQQKNKTENKANTANEVAKQLELSRRSLTAEIIEELETVTKSLHAKQRALNHFSIAFMGKTKAGKSTLHAIITGEGWDAIGVGKQRTTRLNRVYEWRNIRIIDTPGIGAPGGKSDEEIAKSVIDESDVICYVVTNDSIQETEFQFMKLLKEKAKPLIILLNVKYNLRDDRRLEHFLKKPEQLFAMDGNSSLKGHFDRIYRYANEHYNNDYFSIIPVMLLSAQISREPEHQELKDKLFQASKIQDFLDSIRESLIKYGAIRRSQTLLGSTVGSIENPYQWVKQQAQTYQQLTNALKNKRREIKDKIIKAEDDNFRWLKTQINAVFMRVTNNIQGFAESHWEDNEQQLNSAWEQKLKEMKFEEGLKDAYEEAGRKFNKDVEIAIQEIGTELKLIAQLSNVSSFNLKEQDSNAWLQQGLKIAGIGLLGVAGIVALIPGGFVALPFVIAAGIVGGIAQLFKSKEKKRSEAVEKIRSSLTEQLNQHQDKIIDDLKNKFTEYCSSINKNITEYFNELINGLQLITDNLETASSQLDSNIQYLNRSYAKRILDWCLDQYEPLDDAKVVNTIAKVKRDFGKTINIKPRQTVIIKKTPSEIKEVLQEDVIFEIKPN